MQEEIITKEELRERRKKLRLTQFDLSEYSGYGYNYISQIELGKREITERFSMVMKKVLSALEEEKENEGMEELKPGEKIPYFAGFNAKQKPEDEQRPNNPLAVPTIPVVGMAAAAAFDPSLSNLCELWECTEERVACACANAEELFGVRISGDSMAPALLDGDIIAVSDTLPATGDLCIAMHRRDGVLCKRWYWKNGVVRLEAINPEGRSYEWTKETFSAEQPLVWRFRVEALIYRKLH